MTTEGYRPRQTLFTYSLKDVTPCLDLTVNYLKVGSPEDPRKISNKLKGLSYICLCFPQLNSFIFMSVSLGGLYPLRRRVRSLHPVSYVCLTLRRGVNSKDFLRNRSGLNHPIKYQIVKENYTYRKRSKYQLIQFVRTPRSLFPKITTRFTNH